jgi:hypothetical protein
MRAADTYTYKITHLHSLFQNKSRTLIKRSGRLLLFSLLRRRMKGESERILEEQAKREKETPFVGVLGEM